MQISYQTRRVIDLQFFLGLFEHVKSRGRNAQGVDQWSAKCPAHESQGTNTGNLSLGFSQNGKILVHCYGGCNAGEVLAAVGLRLQDIYPDGALYERSKSMGESKDKGYYEMILALAKEDRAKGLRLNHGDKQTELDAYLKLKSFDENWPKP